MATKKAAQPKVDSADTQPKDVILSLRIDGPVHDRLRELAFDRRRPMRDFIMQGIEQVLKAEKY